MVRLMITSRNSTAAAVLFLLVIMSLTILQRVISRKFVHYY